MPAVENAEGRRASELVHDAAREESAEVLARLGTSPAGLSEEAAAERLERFGPNEVAQEKKHTWLLRLYHAALNPLVILLTVIAILTFATAEVPSDNFGGAVIVAMVLLG